MGKKTVLIAVQNTLNRKASRIRESAIGAWSVIGNFKTMLRRNADRKGYLEGICLSETNNSSTIREHNRSKDWIRERINYTSRKE